MEAGEIEDSSKAVGAQVRAARALQGVSLRSLAQAIGVSPATLSQIERGRTSLSVNRLNEIAKELGVGVSDILDVKPAPDRGEQKADLGWRIYRPLELNPILQAALEDFVTFGYHGSAIRDIAKRAGFSVSGIYHHYESKQVMLLNLMASAMTDLLSRAEAARDEGRDSVERFAALIENLALFHTYRIKLMVVGGAEQRSLEPDNRKVITQMRVRAQRLIDEQVDQAVRDGRFLAVEARERTRAIVTMLTALPTWWRPNGPLGPEQVADIYVRLALDLMTKPR